MADRSGERLGNYRLVRLLGAGGFAEVYLGEHTYLGTQAAIKLLNMRVAQDDIDQFQQEARLLANLIHPHIVRVLEFGIDDRTPYLVMDYAPGGSLRAHHPKGSRLPLLTVVDYIQQAARALQYAHDRKLIHRDVKPANMLIGRSGEILLSDFGIALIVQSSRNQSTKDMAGTISYMAPEQIGGHPRTASDQYALGIIAYEWLCGRRPFHGSFTEIATQHHFTPPPSLLEYVPRLPLMVERVIFTALAKKPEERFASVSAFAKALARACADAASGPSQPRMVQTSLQRAVSASTPSPGNAATPANSPAPIQAALPALVTPPESPAPVVSSPSRENPHRPETVPLLPVASAAKYIPPVSVTVKNASPLPSTRTPEPGNLPRSIQEPAKSGVSRRMVLIRAAGLATVSMAGMGAFFWLIRPQSFTYRLHTDAVTSVAWSPNGKRIASGSDDMTVQVWNASDGSQPFAYKRHSAQVISVAWSPDGQHIASGSEDGTVQVWNASNGSGAYSYHGHNGTVAAVAWSPDGRRIASGSFDGTVQVWNASDGSQSFTYYGHNAAVNAVAWSPDGQRIASGSGDGTVQVWNASNGSQPFIYKGQSSGVNSVAWSPNGKHIASGSADNTVQIWDASDGSLIFTYAGHREGVESVAWSPDGKRIASGSQDKTVQVWNASDSSQAFIYAGHSATVNSVAWSPDSKRIASGSADKTVQVWIPG